MNRREALKHGPVGIVGLALAATYADARKVPALEARFAGMTNRATGRHLTSDGRWHQVQVQSRERRVLFASVVFGALAGALIGDLSTMVAKAVR